MKRSPVQNAKSTRTGAASPGGRCACGKGRNAEKLQSAGAKRPPLGAASARSSASLSAIAAAMRAK